MSGIRRAISVARSPETVAHELHAALWQPQCCLVLVFAAPAMATPALAEALTWCFGSVPVAGCTTSGEIGPGGYAEGSVVGISLAGPDFAASIGLIDHLSRMDAADMQATVRRVRLAMHDTAPWARHENLFALTLIDGLCGCEELVASAACGALAGIPLRGGSAADGLRFRAAFVLHGGAFRGDCALIAVVATRRRFRAFKTEHFTAGEERLVVTGADPRRRVVTEINAEPAALEYARASFLSPDQLIPASFATRPLVVRVGGQCFVRSLQGVNEDGSLTFLCAIDEGVVMTVGRGGDLLADLRARLDAIERDIGRPDLLIAFDCFLRGLELDQLQIRDAAGRLMESSNAAGFSTYGEQYEAMHMNQTFSGIAIGAAHA